MLDELLNTLASVPLDRLQARFIWKVDAHEYLSPLMPVFDLDPYERRLLLNSPIPIAIGETLPLELIDQEANTRVRILMKAGFVAELVEPDDSNFCYRVAFEEPSLAHDTGASSDPSPADEARREGSLRRMAGFTIVELMVVLTVAAVVMAAAAPSLKVFLQNNRLQDHTLRIANDVNLARSEAVKRRSPVVLCRSANPTASTPTCSGNTQVWTTGWLIFADLNSNSTYEAASDQLLKIGEAIDDPELTVRTNATSNRNLEYNPDGSTNESGGTARFAVCDDRGGATGRQINVPPHGRLRIVKGSNSDAVACSNPTA
jgi:type IV fimbrial biogenesis protein FimT